MRKILHDLFLTPWLWLGVTVGCFALAFSTPSLSWFIIACVFASLLIGLILHTTNRS